VTAPTDLATGEQASGVSSRRQFRELAVARVDRLCDDAVAVTFAVPPELAGEFAFRPGQSLTLRRFVDGREERRSYSICAPAGEQLRIGVREVPDGAVSGWLVGEVRPGDVVEVQPPSGSFTADLQTPGRHVLIAAGSGITPVLSITASALRHPDAQATVLYGNRRADSVMFADEIADLKDSYPVRLQLAHVLSREPQEVELFSGRLDADRLRRLLPALCAVESVDHWWLCGPYGMVTDAMDVLTELGVPAGRVHRELFYVEEAPPDQERHEEPPLTGGCEVTVILDGRTSTTTIEPGTPVLDGAQRARPDLPFACKGGVCGTCRALLRSGEVRMRRNFALEPAELAAGFVLTCQSLPVTDQVTVDYDA
jgi:ring-1,2-phenylacetyl-CoA epoxidase subunit PaaE